MEHPGAHSRGDPLPGVDPTVDPHGGLLPAASLADLHDNHILSFVRFPDVFSLAEIIFALEVIEPFVHVLDSVVACPIHTMLCAGLGGIGSRHQLLLHEHPHILHHDSPEDALLLQPGLQTLPGGWGHHHIHWPAHPNLSPEVESSLSVESLHSLSLALILNLHSQHLVPRVTLPSPTSSD